MVGTKRSTRLAARQSKPKYNEFETEEDGGNSSKKIESDDDGESALSEGGGSDDASEALPNKSPLPPTETRAVTRRGKLEKQTKCLSETPKPSTRKSLKSKAKKQSKVRSLYPIFDQKEKSEISPSTDDDGSDHAQEDGCDQRKDISLKSSKRSRSTSDASRECKTPKLGTGNNGKSPPPDDELSDSNATRKANDDPTSQPLNNLGGATSADSGKHHDADDPPTFCKVDGDEGGRERESGVHDYDSKDGATQKDPEPRRMTDKRQGNAPITANRNDSNPYQKMESPPLLTNMPGEIPTYAKFLDGFEKGARPKGLTESDTTKCEEDIPNDSIRPNKTDLKGKRVVDTAGDKPVDATENDNQGGNDQTSDDPSMQIDCQEKEHHNDNALLAGADDIDKLKRTTGALTLKYPPTVPFSPPVDRKETLSSGGEASAPTEVKKEAVDGKSESIIYESNGAIDKKEPDHNKSGQLKYSFAKTEHNDARKDDGGSATLDLVTSGENARSASGEKLDATVGSNDMMSIIVSDETTLHYPISQTSKETQCPSSSEIQIGDSHISSQHSTASTVSMSIQYPKSKRTREAPSVDQLKMALFLEASNAHRGNGAQRIFSNYWETLEKYVALGSHGTIKRMRSDLSAAFAGIEAALRGFLKTRKMKRLHNKLVLAIMTEAMRTNIPERCSSHVPQQWQTAAIKSIPDQFNEKDVSVDVNCSDRKSDLLQWNATFGPRSGAWTMCGDELALTKTDSRQSIRPELVGSIHKGGLEEEEVLPSARLPGALEIEPLVRKHTENSGLTASENAIWMLVVAVREHSSSLIKKVIANDKDFDDGYAPSLPTHFQTSLACHRLTTENGNGLKKGRKIQDVHCGTSSGKLERSGKKVINSTSLSHVLAETSSIASRLISIRSAVISDDRGASAYCPGLDNVNCIINASIQRGASKRQRSSTEYQNVLSTATTSHSTSASPVHINSGPKTQSDGNLAKAQPSTTQSLPTTSLSLNKPQLAAQRRIQSIPTLQPPQSQSGLPTMSSQNMRPLNSAQLMNHSDHMKEIKPFEQQTLPISRADIPNLEPLTKPGFPSFTNVSQKPEPSQNSAPPTKTSPPPPPPREVKRGSKNLAAMMARPSSQPKPASDKGSAAGDENNANGESLDKATIVKQKGETEEQKDRAIDAKDDTKESKPSDTGPSRPRGRGFGVKNLSRMRARSSFTDSEK